MSYRKLLVTIVWLLGSGSISAFSHDPVKVPLSPVPDVPERYWFLYEPNWPIRDGAMLAARKGLPFETISLQRGGGLGPPNYTITLHRDGTAQFIGGVFSRRKGQFNGSVTLEDYGRLCYLIERLNLNSLPEDIRKDKASGSHACAAIIRAKKSGEVDPLVNQEINQNGPVELWAIQMSIDAVANNIEWKPIANAK